MSESDPQFQFNGGVCWNDIKWRFNACFDERDKAEVEVKWYLEHGYVVDLRMRTTWYQRQEHVTTGEDPSDDEHVSDVNEWPEGSGG